MWNKKLWKSAMALALALTMALSAAACGKDGEQTPDSNPQGQQDNPDGQEGAQDNADPFGAYEETVTCTLGRRTQQNPKLPEGDSYEENAYMSWVEDRFNAALTNAFESTDGEDYERQVALAISSEELPDMMTVDRATLEELVENDMLADLTTSYENYATDYIKDIYDSYEGRCLGSATFDGRLMALPTTSPDSAPSQVWIRQDWLDQLNIQLDTDGNSCITREELEMTAKEFLAKDPGGNGNPVGIAFTYDMNAGDNLEMQAISCSFGAFQKKWFQKEDGTVYNGSTTPQMKEALAYMNKLFTEGILDPQFGTRTWDDITALMTNGQTGIIFGVWHIPDWLLSNIKAMDPKASFTSFALEDGNGKVNVFHGDPAGNYVVVRKGYEHPELAVKMINLFHDERVTSKTLEQDAPDVYKYEQLGVDGSVRPLPVEINSNVSLLNDYSAIMKCVNGEADLEEMPTLEAKNMVGHIQRYNEDPNTTDVIDWSRYHSRTKGIQLIQNLTDNGSFAWVSPLYLGTTETMKSSGANLDKLEAETFIKMIIGEEPIDHFDSFVEQWNAQGGAAICEELAEKAQ